MRTGSLIPFFERAVGLAQLVQDRDADDSESPSGARIARRRWTHPFVLIRRIFGNAVFSSLTRRILFFNLAALVVLVGGILYLNQFREGLIDARVESLLTQGEIIAGAVSASASVDTNSITIDPQKLLELQAGQSITPVPNDEDLEFPIDPEKGGAGADAADLADAHPRPHL
jgi:two-component system sensor histidine kinase ChvG